MNNDYYYYIIWTSWSEIDGNVCIDFFRMLGHGDINALCHSLHELCHILY